MSKYSFILICGVALVLAMMSSKAESKNIEEKNEMTKFFLQNMEDNNVVQLKRESEKNQVQMRMLKEKKDYKKAFIAFLVLFIIFFIVLIVLIILFLRSGNESGNY